MDSLPEKVVMATRRDGFAQWRISGRWGRSVAMMDVCTFMSRDSVSQNISAGGQQGRVDCPFWFLLWGSAGMLGSCVLVCLGRDAPSITCWQEIRGNFSSSPRHCEFAGAGRLPDAERQVVWALYQQWKPGCFSEIVRSTLRQKQTSDAAVVNFKLIINQRNSWLYHRHVSHKTGPWLVS